MNILVINGPNLNLLGIREPIIYGKSSLESLEEVLNSYAKEIGVEIQCFQSNSEGSLIDKLHWAMGKFDGVILNAGAYTHYSYAIRDAISAINIPVIEVHISNIYARESFRHSSVIAPVCIGQISGFGIESYKLALKFFKDLKEVER